VLKWRRAVYGLAMAGLLVFAALASDPRAMVGATMFLVAWFVGRGLLGERPHVILLTDLGVSVGLWWLYGPISGAAFVVLGVAAISPFLLTADQSRTILIVALATIPIRVGLHFLADEIEFPLFHAREPVPTSEFLTGEGIQALLLLGIGILMMRIAVMLRRGLEALAADLDRQRDLNALKDRFVATVSHQLRTPLTSLKGFSTALLEGDHDPEERREFLTIMSDQAEELHALIEDLITFSRIGAGGLALKPTEIELRKAIGMVIAGFGARAERVSNQVPPGITVLVDGNRLHQVLRNLVDNALKYGEPPVVISAALDGSVVRCRVLDAGGGVDPKKIDLVFEPYARLVDDPTMSRPGIGLGLPIVRGLIEAHGGTVHAVTRGGMGGFEVSLPAQPDDHHSQLDSSLLSGASVDQ